MGQTRAGAEAPRSQGGEAPASKAARTAGRPRVRGARKRRVQFILDAKLVERLKVHCSIHDKSMSSLLDEVLLSWLCRYGKGRELFGPGGSESVDPEAGDAAA